MISRQGQTTQRLSLVAVALLLLLGPQPISRRAEVAPPSGDSTRNDPLRPPVSDYSVPPEKGNPEVPTADESCSADELRRAVEQGHRTVICLKLVPRG